MAQQQQERQNFSQHLKTIRRFADRSKRWLMAYINWLSKDQREFAEKQYKSHRREYRQIFVYVDELDHSCHSDFLI